jgi:hypothetical protein
MAADVETELLEVFESLGSALYPSPELANRVRQRVRTRRRRIRWVSAVAVVALAIVGIAIFDHAPTPPTVTLPPAPKLTLDISAVNVEAMAARGDRLYVARNAYPRGLLEAYDLRSGAKLSSAPVPAGPSSVVVAADGTVWVAFFPSNAGRRAGVAEFSPNLRQRSMLLTDGRYLGTDAYDVMPQGRGRALLATAAGLVSVTMPPLGQRRTVHANPTNAHPTGPPISRLGTPVELARLSNGAVAVLLVGNGRRSTVILTRGSARVSGAQFSGTEVTFAPSPDGLWVTSGVGPRSALQRLSTTLTPLPVGDVIHTQPLPGGWVRVWTSNRTVWVATRGRRISLTCFAFSDPQHEPGATIDLPAEDGAEHFDPVVSGDLTVLPLARQVYVASPFGITSYPVPAACRS